jgi:hypothetical protein
LVGSTTNEVFRFQPYSLCSFIAAALLAGCGGPQPPIDMPGAMTQTPGNRSLCRSRQVVNSLSAEKRAVKAMLRAGVVCLAAFLTAGQAVAQGPTGIYVARSSNAPTGHARDGLALSLSPQLQPIYPDGAASIRVELRNVSNEPKRIYIRRDQDRLYADPDAIYAFTVVSRETREAIPISRETTSSLSGDDIQFPVTAHDLPSMTSAYARFDRLTYYYPLSSDGTYLVTASTWVGMGATGVFLHSNTITIIVRGSRVDRRPREAASH